MLDAGDEPRSDELFMILSPEGNKISQTFGRDAIYYYLEVDNAVNRVPFR